MKQHNTRLERINSRIKNNPLTASVIVLGTMIIALAAFTGAVKDLLSLIEWNRPEAARSELAQLSLKFTPDVFIHIVKKGDTHAARLFLTAGMVPNVKDRNGATALMHAAYEGDIPIIDLLLDAKANVNERNKGGFTALSWAVNGKNKDIVGLLLDRGADVEAINKAFLTAAKSGWLEMLRIMLDKGADVKRLGSQALIDAANTAVSRVSDKQASDVVRFLLELGVDPNSKGEDGWTALLYASKDGSAAVMQTLLDGGADINAKCDCPLWNDGGWTALMIAIDGRYTEIVEALLSKGADVSIKNHDGQSALSLAIKNGDEGLVQALRDK